MNNDLLVALRMFIVSYRKHRGTPNQRGVLGSQQIMWVAFSLFGMWSSATAQS